MNVAPSERFDEFKIFGKRICIVEKHQHVLRAWTKVKRDFSGPLYLITMDHHSDTHQSLVDWCGRCNGISLMTPMVWRNVFRTLLTIPT